MDEELHVAQAKQFCRNNFTYDLRISTPPGLYFWPFAVCSLSRVFGHPFSAYFVCSTIVLRSITAIFGFLLWVEFQKWTRLSLRSVNRLELFCVWTHPVLFFYFFLYYTDVPALFFVLVGLRYSYQQRSLKAAFLIALATIHRQTSAVFHVLSCVILVYQSTPSLHSSPTSFLCFINTCLQLLFSKPFKCLLVCWPHLFCIIGYSIWTFYRGSIAAGHVEYHGIVFHPTMVVYFLCYYFLFRVSNQVMMTSFLKDIMKRPKYWLMSIISTWLCLQYFDIIHPFLLADVRHYTFYFIRIVLIKFRFLKFLMIPCCMFSQYCYFERLKALGNVEYFCCVFLLFLPLSVIPLLELRYFIPIYVVMELFCVIFSTDRKVEGEEPCRPKSHAEKKLRKSVDPHNTPTFQICWNFFWALVFLAVFFCFPVEWWKEIGSMTSHLKAICRRSSVDCSFQRIMP
eukprot:jgi/Galph1/5514/GphlegSOOS_G4122.1